MHAGEVGTVEVDPGVEVSDPAADLLGALSGHVRASRVGTDPQGDGHIGVGPQLSDLRSDPSPQIVGPHPRRKQRRNVGRDLAGRDSGNPLADQQGPVVADRRLGKPLT